ncbi:hypothetical protein EYC80_003038 [Monilinia laxa]|uniref:Uncharacterized protein n=1 Tax=Monilinia laxa TaxID=61186 RepID=A0A5N6KCJ7_MONLA|nr:hypothetical protein EYC80_003038 [Monilinia laxa]
MNVYLGLSISSLWTKEVHLNNQGATVVRVIACKIAANETLSKSLIENHELLYQENKVLTTSQETELGRTRRHEGNSSE